MNKQFKQWKKIIANKWVIISVGILSALLTYMMACITTHVVSSGINYLHQFLGSARQLQADPTAQPTMLNANIPRIFVLRNFINPVTTPKFLLLIIGLFAIIWLIKMPNKLYQMRVSYRDLNTGSMGTARFTTVEELAKESLAVPLDDSTYAGNSGVPQLHLSTKDAENYVLNIPFLRTDPKAKNKYDAATIRRLQDDNFIDEKRPAPKHGYDFIDTSKTNAAIIAGTQSGKTQLFTYAVLDLIMRAEKKDSVIITDLKGDMVKNTKLSFENHGYDVEVFNLVTPEYSIGYNPLQLIKEAYWRDDYDSAQLLCNTLTYSLFHNQKSHSDPMWEEASIALVNALILAVCYVSKKNNRPDQVTMYTVSVMLNELGSNPDESGTTALDLFFGSLPANDPAKLQYGTITFSQGITRSGIYTGTMAKLKSFTISSVGRLTSKNDLSLESIATGTKPVALFIVYPDYDDSNYALIATFISQIAYVLSKTATLSANSSLKRRVKFVLEEVANIPTIDGLSRYMNVGLQRGIIFYLVFQSISQFKDKYGDKGAEALLSACGNKYDILADGEQDPEYFAKLLGKKTIIAPSRHGDPMSLDKSYGESEQARDLLTAAELGQLRLGEWVLVRNKQRSDLENHKTTARPIFADSAAGHEMLFAYEYLNEFNHPQTFDELNGNKKSEQALVDLNSLIISKECFGIKTDQKKQSKAPVPQSQKIGSYSFTDEKNRYNEVKNNQHQESLLDAYNGEENEMNTFNQIDDFVNADQSGKKISEVLTEAQIKLVNTTLPHYLDKEAIETFEDLGSFAEQQNFIISRSRNNNKFYRSLNAVMGLDEALKAVRKQNL